MLKIPLFALVTIVATFNLSLVESQNSSSDGSQPPNFFGIPLPFQIPQFHIPQLPFFREEQVDGPPTDVSANESLSEHGHEDQDKFFFGLFRPASALVTCNFTTQGGARCSSCTTALTCGSRNVGRLRVCRGFFPYCNLGRCSFYPGERCFNSTG